MIRFSVVICLSVLLFSTSAKPFRPRENVFGKAVQRTVMFDQASGKMILGMKEVEPLEDMDHTDFDIDPNMLIWKAVKEETEQKYDRPEEDEDDLYHPLDIKIPADLKQLNYFQPAEHVRVQKYDRPEEDMDDLYHRVFNADAEPMREEKDVIGGDVRPIYSSPEEDKDDVYHADVKGHLSDQQLQPINIFHFRPERVKHTQPEEDLDDLYHNI